MDKDRIPRVKIKIGESWGSREDRDLTRVALARSVIGPDTELYVDANGGYGSVAQAVRVAYRMERSGVTWFEEPVSSQDLAGLAAVRGQVLADVAAGEYSWTLADSARLLTAGAVDCLQLDVTRCGGITEFLRAAALAAAHNLQVSGHCAPNLHAHCAAAVPNLRHVEYFHDHQRIERMFFDGALDPHGGALVPGPWPARAGPGAAYRRRGAVPPPLSGSSVVPPGGLDPPPSLLARSSPPASPFPLTVQSAAPPFGAACLPAALRARSVKKATPSAGCRGDECAGCVRSARHPTRNRRL